MEKVKKMLSYIGYWHERILLATEVSLGQPWDIIIIHIFLFMLFLLFWYFNYRLINSFSPVTSSASSFAKDEL